MIAAHCETNGHGTWYINWDWLAKSLRGKEDQINAKKVCALLKIANTTGYDAISNLLMIEAVMRDRDYNVTMLSNLYKDNPSNLFKATVTDKRKFVTSWDETKITEPKRLQDIIEVFTNDIPEGRAFIRPSGTEDLLRIYVEAKKQEDV